MMVELIIKSFALAGFGVVLLLVTRRASAAVRHWLCVVTLVSLLLAPAAVGFGPTVALRVLPRRDVVVAAESFPSPGGVPKAGWFPVRLPESRGVTPLVHIGGTPMLRDPESTGETPLVHIGGTPMLRDPESRGETPLVHIGGTPMLRDSESTGETPLVRIGGTPMLRDSESTGETPLLHIGGTPMLRDPESTGETPLVHIGGTPMLRDSESTGVTPLVHIGETPMLRGLKIVWLLGFFGVLGYFVTGFVQAHRLLRRSAHLRNERVRSIASECAMGLGSRKRIRLRIAEDSGPLSIGHFRPFVILPSNVSEWDEEQIRAVMIHEIAHVERGDWALYAIGNLVTAMYWFNPLVWFVSGRLRAESERACDDTVLDSGLAGTTYAQHLVNLARNGRSVRSAAAVAQPPIEGRVRAILDGSVRRSKPRPFMRFGLATLAVALCFGVSSLKLAEASAVDGTHAKATSHKKSTTKKKVVQHRKKKASSHNIAVATTVRGSAAHAGRGRTISVGVGGAAAGQNMAPTATASGGFGRGHGQATTASGGGTVNVGTGPTGQIGGSTVASGGGATAASGGFGGSGGGYSGQGAGGGTATAGGFGGAGGGATTAAGGIGGGATNGTATVSSGGIGGGGQATTAASGGSSVSTGSTVVSGGFASTGQTTESGVATAGSRNTYGRGTAKATSASGRAFSGQTTTSMPYESHPVSAYFSTGARRSRQTVYVTSKGKTFTTASGDVIHVVYVKPKHHVKKAVHKKKK